MACRGTQCVGGAYAVVNKESLLGEHPLKVLLSVKGHLLAVLVHVGAKRDGDGFKGLNSLEQIRCDHVAMFDPMSGIFPGIRLIEPFYMQSAQCRWPIRCWSEC